MLDVALPLPTKRRASGPRSRRGCQHCKRRHVKCDETGPPCGNCKRSGLACQGLSTVLHVPRSSKPIPMLKARLFGRNLDSNPDWSPLEARIYHQYASAMAPLIGDALDQAYWTSTMLCMARGNGAIFHAIIASSTFHEMPSSHLIAQEQYPLENTEANYRRAVRWYASSLEQSSKLSSSLSSDVDVILVGAVLFVYNESLLGHIKNAETLMQRTFALIHSTPALRIRSSMALAGLVQLLRLSAGCVVDVTAVPRAHRQSAMMHALRTASEAGTPESFLLRMELTSLIWDVTDTMAGNLEETAELEERIAVWTARSTSRQWSAQDQFCLQSWQLYQVPWLYYKFGVDSSRILIEHILITLIRKAETLIDIVSESKADFLPLLESDILPVCMLVVWYWRKSMILTRIKQALQRYPVEHEITRQSLDYLKDLMHTPYDEATCVEIELFGEKPKVFLPSHSYRCMKHMAELAASLERGN